MVRTRFAPSPTGSLHVGNARIGVLNWLFTRQQNGVFILRIEDTDMDREIEGAESSIFADLRWLGLEWDEGPEWAGRPEPGRHGPYRQSERLAFYQQFATRLREAGHTYDCFCTPQEIEQMREAAIARGDPAHYDGRCRELGEAAQRRLRAEGRVPALRFRVPPGEAIIVHDVVRGDVTFAREEIGDFVLLRADGLPTYNFAVVVDDVLMEITHVIRGVGHLSNTPRQVLLYDALQAAPPSFVHVPMVLGPDRTKLSKRHGAKALSDYAREGYHPDAVINYLSLLSWSSPTGEEFLTRDRLIADVSLERIGIADVVFDEAKLRWLSAKHIEAMPLDALVQAVGPYFDAARAPVPDELLPRALAAVRSHLATFSEVNEHLATFFAHATATPRALDEDAARVLRSTVDELSTLEQWEERELQSALGRAAAAAGVKGRSFYEPLRFALTGTDHGPPFAVLLLVQGRERVLNTLQTTLAARRQPGENG